MKRGQRISQLALIVMVLFFASAAWGIQATTTYQGKITDTTGIPVNNASANMFFRLWNDPDSQSTKDSLLWEEKHLGVVIENGIFSLILGKDVALPSGTDVADNHLWLEIEYEGEIMTPRLALSSVAGALYAEKAGDADTVGGIASNTLILDTDLTGHTNNASAHHTKTTRFTELTGDVDDRQIPASITRDWELDIHQEISSAHHTRYSNAEAVAAMGDTADSNSLNHVKYTDNQAVAALMANDGSGSGLDADLLDGQHASDIIDAAADEVRTPISTSGQVITQSGSYYLTQNLSCTNHGIFVSTDNVTIDLMGFTLSGTGAVGYNGIYLSNSSNVEIKNGTIRHFSRGIWASPTDESSIRVINVRVESNTSDGILLHSTNNLIKDSTVTGNGGTGIITGKSSVVTGNTAYNNGGKGVDAGSGCTITNNTASSNSGDGIYALDCSTMTHNSSYDNQVRGIYVGAGSQVIGNSVKDNGSWGIDTKDGAGCLVRNNTISYNGYGAGFSDGGLRLGEHNIVSENVLYYNRQHTIYVYKGGNVIENNLIANSTAYGIYFDSINNYYKNNRASGNSGDDFKFIYTNQVDGGGNIVLY